MVSNKYRKIEYGFIQVPKTAKAAFMECQEGRETQEQTLLKLIKTFKEQKNRKCPDLSQSEHYQTKVENA